MERQRLFIVYMVCIIAAAMVLPCAAAGSITRIAAGAGFRDHPAVDGDRVVWTDPRNGNNDIYLFDLTTGTERQITSLPSNQAYPRISGDRIDWMDGRSGGWHIWLYDLGPGTESRVGTNAAVQTWHDISGDRIVWLDMRNPAHGELWLYDLSTGEEMEIAPNSQNPDNPAISGTLVAYNDNRDGNTDIYLYDLVTGIETRVTSDPGYSVFPDIDGDTIVWGDTRSGGMDIYGYDIPTGTEWRISSAPEVEEKPAISGNLATWHWRSPAGMEAIVLYDIPGATETLVVQNTNSKGDPDISGNRVAWAEAGAEGSSIYVYDREPVDYLTADFEVDRLSATAFEPVIFTDTTGGWTPTGWEWSFGDGTSSNEQSPVHAYQAPGSYTVSLTVKAAGGLTDTVTKPNFIVITPPSETETPTPEPTTPEPTTTATPAPTPTPAGWLDAWPSPNYLYTIVDQHAPPGEVMCSSPDYTTYALSNGLTTVGCVGSFDTYLWGTGVDVAYVGFNTSPGYCIVEADFGLSFTDPASSETVIRDEYPASPCRHQAMLQHSLGDIGDISYYYLVPHLVVEAAPAPTPTPAPEYTPCTGDGRGMIEILAPPGSEFAEYSPWGYGTGDSDNHYVPIDPSGQTCFLVDGCYPGPFRVFVRLPDGTTRQSPEFSLESETSWDAGRNSCYYLFDSTVEPEPTPEPTPPAPLPSTYFWSGGDGGTADGGANDLDNHLYRSFDLSGVTSATLQVNATYNIESGYDSGSIDITVNGGASWERLATYTGDTDNGNAVTSPTVFTLDLSPYAGNNNVIIDFRYTTDYSYSYSGWNISEMKIPEIGFSEKATAWDSDCTGWYGNGWTLQPSGSPVTDTCPLPLTPTPTTTPTDTPTATPTATPTLPPGFEGCMGEGRGLIQIEAPPGSRYAAFGPWGWWTGDDSNRFTAMDTSGLQCIIVDGCWGLGSGLYGFFNLSVMLPDGTVQHSPEFGLDRATTWTAERNACYYSFEVEGTTPTETPTPTPTPVPDPVFPAAGGTFTSIARGATSPAIDDSRIVWTDGRNGNNDIYLMDLATGTEQQITTDPGNQNYPHISGNRIIWMDGRNGGWHIWLYDLGTGRESRVGTNTAVQIWPDISGDRIVWLDTRNPAHGELWLYDISTGQEMEIAPNAQNPDNPSISGNLVTYNDNRNGNTDIYLYNLATGSETRVTSDASYSVFPDISGNTILWGDTRSGGADIYGYSVSTGAERQVSSTGVVEEKPAISGNLAAWELTSPTGHSIVMYDMANRTAMQITPNGLDCHDPDVSGNRIVWVQNWNGIWDLELFTWSGDPVKFLVADLYANHPATPALEPVNFKDTSYGMTPVSWSWDFGDGSTSILQHPVHTYQTPGTYTVSLTVGDSSGVTDTVTKTDYMEVTEPLTTVPVPDFTVTSDYGTIPLQVTFFDKSMGYPSSWSWDFGDGGTATGQSVTHMYTRGGVFTVSLTATNHVGSGTTVKRDLITAVDTTPPPPPPPSPPFISSLSPAYISGASPGFTLTVLGSNFNENSEVQWNGRGLTTRVVSDTEVRADIAQAYIPTRMGTIPVQVINYRNSGGFSNKVDFYLTAPPPTPTPSPTPTPIPQPGALSLVVTPKQRSVEQYRDLVYDIDVFQDGHLVPADINVKLDGNSIASFRASHYTYTFYPPSTDEHYLEITATDNGRRASPDPWRRKIFTYGSITPALLMANTMHTAADNEIVEGENLAADRSVDFVETTSNKIVGSVLELSMDYRYGDQMKEAVWSWWPGLAHEDPVFFQVAPTLMLLRGYVEVYIPELIGRASTMYPLPEQQKEYEVLEMKNKLHSNFNIDAYTGPIGSQSDSLRAYIKDNPETFLDTENLRNYFKIHTEPLSYVVDDYQFPFHYIGNYDYVLTMRQTADEYDQVKSIGEGLDLSLLVSRMTTSSAGIAINCGANLAEMSAFDTVFTAVNSGMKALAILSNSLSLYFVTLQGFQIVTLQNYVPIVASATNGLHDHETYMIKDYQAQASSLVSNLMARAEDTWILSPTEISSPGTSMIVTPDGRIVEFIREEGMFTPKYAGTYSVVSYPISGYSLADAEVTTFEATIPQVSLEAGHTLNDHLVTIHTRVCNKEVSPTEDLSLQIIIVDIDGKPVSIDGAAFSLEGSTCTDSDFEMSLPGDGIFIVHLTLVQHLFIPIKEQSFSLNAGGVVQNDAAILGIEKKPVYSALEPVVLNVTMESFTPDLTFHLKVPDAGYDQEVTVTGIRSVLLALPPLQPKQYVLTVVAEADGKVLDARTLSLIVEAEGTGILTIMPEKVFYPLDEPVSVRLALKDLLMNPLDAQGHVLVINPDGAVSDFSSPIGNGQLQFQFTPPVEGTYVIEGTAYKQGWRISGDRTLVIVGNMSPLLMDVQKAVDEHTVRVYANGLPAQCYLTMASKGVTKRIFVSDGLAIINQSGSFTLTADKMFYEPAYYSYVAPETLPTAGFTVNETAGTAPVAFRFTDMSIGKDLTSWTWAFGDGTYAYDQNPVHVYEVPGTYSVTLTVANASGSNYLTKTDYISVAAPVMPMAGFAADQQAGKAPLTVTLTDASTGEPSSWLWNFGDGGTSEEVSPVHVYMNAGTYEVSLTVTNGAGSDTKTLAGFITVLPVTPPVADFSGIPESGNSPLKVTFTDLSSGDPESWTWSFGDGATSTEQSPSHEYATPGLYTVSLTVVNPDGTNTKTRQDYITVTAPATPPVARFSVSPQAGKAPLAVTFMDRSTGAPESWEWTFGDGQNLDLRAPVHVYSRAGLYLARLKVTNGGGSDTAWKLVLVLPRWLPWG